ncbi:MAG: Succinate dehydrogenase flavoprotein subunit [Promethearchaeota archaeon]|nr:MAG: Succinate dehydrogenase flavoprotein subunit [Candidatus Lokiarchaeota archaeon]
MLKWNEVYMNKIQTKEIKKFHTIIIGSGAAGLNCALHLIEEKIPPNEIALITEKLGGGTSFNTGSDKQTYYKMAIVGSQQDSPYEMAQTYYKGGAMHGDIALIEATNSLREFFHLVQLGVPFPHDEFGGYIGYKTDYDPKARATSIGPLTSQKMCECLLSAVKTTDIPIFDKYYAVEILNQYTQYNNQVVGLIALDLNLLSNKKDVANLTTALKVFQAKNIILATGGPAALYKYSVYPSSQWGGLSLAIKAGCKFQNLTESQFGLASIKFRWNLSGSYQQVIPRYLSIDKDGNEREFLNNYFDSFEQLSKAIFLKGYQWPFSAERIEHHGSSLIDLAVYYEKEKVGNRVFLDYTKNPSHYDQALLYYEAKKYLENSNALLGEPIERLLQLNKAAFELFKTNNIDLSQEYLEIALCNQHLNGGVCGNIWWESTVNHLFVIGEANGSHGVHRPGGSALNSGQVGGLRTAQRIGNAYTNSDFLREEDFRKIFQPKLKALENEFTKILLNEEATIKPKQMLSKIQNRMSKFGSIIRPMNGFLEAIKELHTDIYTFPSKIKITRNPEILEYLRVRDALLTQQYILEAILNYHHCYGASRGSSIVIRDSLNDSYRENYITPPDKLRDLKFIVSENKLSQKIQTIQPTMETFRYEWEDIRDIPQKNGWFEIILKKYKKKQIFQ